MAALLEMSLKVIFRPGTFATHSAAPRKVWSLLFFVPNFLGPIRGGAEEIISFPILPCFFKHFTMPLESLNCTNPAVNAINNLLLEQSLIYLVEVGG